MSPPLPDPIIIGGGGPVAGGGPRSTVRLPFTPTCKMVSASREMAVYCFDTLVAHYNSEHVPPPAFEEGQHPLFVTWKKAVNGAEPYLRGCIGTLEAHCIIRGFRDYALTSALRDHRFPPIQAKELPYLECTVSVLTDYESALDYLDWEVCLSSSMLNFFITVITCACKIFLFHPSRLST